MSFFRKWMGKQVLVGAAVGTLLFYGGVGSTHAASTSVKDVKNHWAKSVIEKAIKDDYVTGYTDQTFRPNNQVTREEFAAILARVKDVDDVTAPDAGFRDVKGWSVNAVNQAVSLGYVSKADYGTTFAPKTALTRGEAAEWLARGLAKSDAAYAAALEDLQETLLPFADWNQIGARDRAYVALVRGTGIVTGLPNGSYGAKQPVTRAEIVAMLYRYLAAEAKTATDFKELAEMREVGKTGTNLLTMGGKLSPKGKIENIIGPQLKTATKKFEISTSKLIFVDSYKARPTSVYTDMFLEDGAKPTIYGGINAHAMFSLVQYKSHGISGVSEYSLAGAVEGVTGYALPESVARSYNLPTLLRINGGVDLKANFVNRNFGEVWLTSVVSDTTWKSFQTVAGVRVSYSLPAK